MALSAFRLTVVALMIGALTSLSATPTPTSAYTPPPVEKSPRSTSAADNIGTTSPDLVSTIGREDGLQVAEGADGTGTEQQIIGVPGGAEAVEVAARRLSLDGIEVVTTLPELGAIVVESATADVHTTLARVAEQVGIAWSEPDHVTLPAGVPDDPQYGSQWALDVVDAEGAWAVTAGDPGVVVAVLDSGIDFGHPEFAGRLVPGIDIFNRDGDPSDDNGHGTLISGLIAAATDNDTQIASLGRRTRLMPIKITDANGFSSFRRIAQGIVWATQNGASVINVSSGLLFRPRVLEAAVGYAEDRGVLVVASAGNFGSIQPYYPAAFERVVGVAATEEDDEIWPSSNGGEWLTMSAPGVGVLSTSLGGGTLTASGTSYAAAHVSAAAALIRAANPDAEPADVRQLLSQYAVDLGAPGFDHDYGHGRLDAAATVTAAANRAARCTAPNTLVVRRIRGNPRSVAATDALVDRLRSRGHVVTEVSDRLLGPDHWADKDVVYLAPDVRMSLIPDALASTPTRLVTSPPRSAAFLGLSSGPWRGHQGPRFERSLDIGTTDIAGFAGLAGRSVLLSHRRAWLPWVDPSPLVDVTAWRQGHPDQAVVLSTEAGDQNELGQAPERRSALILDDQTGLSLSVEAGELYDATFRWTLNCGAG